MNTTTETAQQSQTSKLTGKVKWFNNKAGFGFITICDGENAGKDIFVHYTSINVENQYKYLVQGEYVDFNLVKSANESHEFHAADVSGIKGGTLMCETRRIAFASQPKRQPSERPQGDVRKYKTRSPSTGDDANDDDRSGGFTKVQNKKSRPPRA
jgi:CspA family cold shock protein